jgi:uncharacterized protein (TIGR02687 family)
MNITQIRDTLNSIFTEKKKRIIFWYDGEKEFEEILPELALENATVIRMDEIPALELKIKLELDDPQGRYVLYAPFHEPSLKDDWLADIRLYGYTFRADKASIILSELGLENPALRSHLKKRKAFFRSQERLNRLKKWAIASDNEDAVDLKILGVLTRADSSEPFTILMRLFESFCVQGEYNPSAESGVWADIEKMEMAVPFRQLISKTFGYLEQESSSLYDLLLRLFVTDFCTRLRSKSPTALTHFNIDNPAYAANISVFLSQWRNHVVHYRTYNLVSTFISKKLNMDDIVLAFDIPALLEVMTFEVCERRIIRILRDQIIQDHEQRFDEIREIIKKRLDGHWCIFQTTTDHKQNHYKTVYNALELSIALFDLRKKYNDGFNFSSGKKLFTAYCNEIHGFDRYYRNFNELADQIELEGWDILKSLRSAVENIYSGWFMDQICLKWGDFLGSESSKDGLLSKWQIPGICNQFNFFKHYVVPIVQKSPRNRIFVIVSDAFRYEIAVELAQEINGKYRFRAETEPMLGILPGYTSLGMASLLPYQTLSYKDDGLDILVDNKPTASMEQRSAVLKNHDGIAVKADDLLAMSKEKGREFVKEYRVIYIYHDQIDAVGDKASSEHKTFEAVRRTINELSSLTSFIINSLNGTRVIITADHGFIYQEKAPDTADKSVLEIKPEGALKIHKRFILGRNLKCSAENVFRGDTKTTSNTQNPLEFLIPKSTTRFHFVGGAKFFHGGAMLQEIMVPVVMISEMKGKHLEASEVHQVGVSLLGSHKKIATNSPRFDFIQTDAVSERMKPRTLKISLRDGNELISAEEIITFDSDSSSMDERKKSVKLRLQAREYDNKKEYYLILRNSDDTEYDRIPLIIDIAFIDDF